MLLLWVKGNTLFPGFKKVAKVLTAELTSVAQLSSTVLQSILLHIPCHWCFLIQTSEGVSPCLLIADLLGESP